MYVYRNRLTSGTVELKKPRESFEASPDWERIEGELPEGFEVEVATDVSGLDDGELVDLFIATGVEFKRRGENLDESALDDRMDQLEAVFGDEDGGPTLFEKGLDEAAEALAEKSDERLLLVLGLVQAEIAKRGLEVNDEVLEPGTPAPTPEQQAENDAKVEAQPTPPVEEQPPAPPEVAEGQPDPAPGSPASTNATPAAAELATEKGIDLATVAGTGLDGKVTIEDVRKVVDAAA